MKSKEEEHKLGKSLKNFHWQVVKQDVKEVLSFTQKLGISDILARILIARGIKNISTAENFLYPRIKNLMPNPFLLKDMEKAANRIANAVVQKEKMVIYADYDVDGASSSALLKRFFRALGMEAEVYIPCRFNEGYGPNLEAFKKLIKEGNQLIITVDCGTVAFEPIKYAQDNGVDVIVIDHHLVQEALPDAYAIVNPNRVDENFQYREMAAVSVVFFVITAIRSVLREKGYFKNKGIKELDIMQYLDLVALGTVCDVMPLTGINRVFVQHGLHLMKCRSNLGLNVLADLLKINKKPHAYHLSYTFGPRINAGGRIGKGHLGSILLSTDSYEEAYQVALDLEKYNEQRKVIENLAYEEAIENIKMNNCEENNILLAYGNDWHLGILGILASRIKEKYQKPAFVISLANGVGRGSARSIKGIDIGLNIMLAKQKGILIKGGGHAMAGGFVIEEDKINTFYDFLLSKAPKNGNIEKIYKQAKILKIDAQLTVNSINLKLFNDLAIAEPFGQGNEKPRFIITNVIIIKSWIISQHHIMFIVKDNVSATFSNSAKCILFRGTDTVCGKDLLNGTDKKVNLVGYLQQNFFDPNKVDFIIEDFSFNE